MDNEPSIPTSDTVAMKPNGRGRAVGMSKELLAKPVTYKNLLGIFEEVVLPLQDRIAELERACGLVPSPKPGIEAIAPVIANFVNARLAPIERLVDELDYSAMRYAGIYEGGKTYHMGQAVTLAGGMWLCQETTDSRPGKGDSGWKLVVKSAEPKRDRDEQHADDR